MAVAIAIGALHSGNAAAAEIRVGGTGTAAGMLQEVGARYAAESGVNVNVIPSLGSSGAIRALIDGRLDIAVSARPSRPDEAASIIPLLALRTPFVLATSRPKPAGMTGADLAKIYANANSTWPDGTPVRIVLRPRSETDSDLMAAMFPGMRDAMEAARRRPEVPTAATDQDNADMAERLTGSLTGTTTTQLKTEGRRLNVITVDGVEPNLGNLESGAYRFAKRLFFLAKAGGSPEIGRFMAFLQSPAGLKLLRDVEVLPEKP
ncbi:MAG: PstS family phosphate ABC transporter substrate-binding protein [Pseudolabrys sp.]